MQTANLLRDPRLYCMHWAESMGSSFQLTVYMFDLLHTFFYLLAGLSYTCTKCFQPIKACLDKSSALLDVLPLATVTEAASHVQHVLLVDVCSVFL